MNIESIAQNGKKIAVIRGDGILINNAADGTDLLGDLYFQAFDQVILFEDNITPDFFNLANGMAGEILQKFSNYRVGLAIVGRFDNLASKSLRDFIRESNRTGRINFVTSLEEGLERLLS